MRNNRQGQNRKETGIAIRIGRRAGTGTKAWKRNGTGEMRKKMNEKDIRERGREIGLRRENRNRSAKAHARDENTASEVHKRPRTNVDQAGESPSTASNRAVGGGGREIRRGIRERMPRPSSDLPRPDVPNAARNSITAAAAATASGDHQLPAVATLGINYEFH